MPAPKDPQRYVEWKRKIILKLQKLTDFRRDKTYEEIYGINKAKEIKRKISKSMQGFKHTEEAKRKIGEGHIGHPMYKSIERSRKISEARKGIPCSEETKRKISKTHTGVKMLPFTEEHKQKIREAKIGENNPMYGKTHSIEVRLKMSNYNMGDRNPNYGKNPSDELKKKIGDSLKEYYIKTPQRKEQIKQQRSKQILPMRDTKIEIKIQMFLKELGYEYFSHQYMKEIEHAYQCDILIPALNLVVECDGDYWHKYPVGTDKDNMRTKELLEKGFKVLRLWECEIKGMRINKFKEDMEIIKKEL